MFKKKDAESSSKTHAISVEQMSWTSAVVMEALVRLLDRKGLVTQKELLNEVKQVQAQVRQQMEQQA